MPESTRGNVGAEEAWHKLEENLAICLADLEEDDVLIVEHKQAIYYLQFAARGAFGMRAEAACNTYIEPPEAALTVEDYERLREMGWTGPTPGGGVSPEDPDGSPNFFIDAARPVDYASLARLAIRALREAYHIAHPRRLQYKGFSFDGAQIRFPTLGLKRRRN